MMPKDSHSGPLCHGVSRASDQDIAIYRHIPVIYPIRFGTSKTLKQKGGVPVLYE